MPEEELNESTEPEKAAPPEEEPYPPRGYAWYVVAVLTLIYVLSFVDRQVIGLLASQIKEAYQISDSQLGLLMGFGFALFYTLGIGGGAIAPMLVGGASDVIGLEATLLWLAVFVLPTVPLAVRRP